MWPTCVHTWPACVVPISHVYPHVRIIFHMMWDTCEILQTHVDIVCPTCDSHEPTCGYMWGSCELLSLSIMLTYGMHVWNWNNTQNPHVNFMWFFPKGMLNIDVNHSTNQFNNWFDFLVSNRFNIGIAFDVSLGIFTIVIFEANLIMIRLRSDYETQTHWSLSWRCHVITDYPNRPCGGAIHTSQLHHSKDQSENQRIWSVALTIRPQYLRIEPTDRSD